MRQITAHIGQIMDSILHKIGRAFPYRRTGFGRIGHASAALLLLFMASCGITESISTERTVTVQERTVNVPVPGSVRSVPFSAADLPHTSADTLTFEDDRVRVTVRKSAPNDPPLAPAGSDSVRGPNDIFLDNYILDIELFADTIQTTVGDSTITERTETVRTKTRTGRFAWMVIGGLLAAVIILLIAIRIRS